MNLNLQAQLKKVLRKKIYTKKGDGNMYNTYKFNKIVAMFICILLFSNFGLSVSLATQTSSSNTAGYIEFSDSKLSEVKIQKRHENVQAGSKR